MPFFHCGQLQAPAYILRMLLMATRNHNWFHGISEPLKPLDTNPHKAHTNIPMTRTQDVRRRFYLALIKLTRLVDGGVLVADVRSDVGEEDIGAILLWQPPLKRMPDFALTLLYQSGLLSLILPWNYGPGSFYRIDQIFEANVKKMLADTLGPRGIKADECGFIQMIAANPRYAGKGYASALLKWQMEQHFEEFPERPVVLDTTTEQGIRTYTRLGYELLAEIPVNTGTDASGFKLRPGAFDEVKSEAKRTCVQRVMVKMPSAGRNLSNTYSSA